MACTLTMRAQCSASWTSLADCFSSRALPPCRCGELRHAHAQSKLQMCKSAPAASPAYLTLTHRISAHLRHCHSQSMSWLAVLPTFANAACDCEP